MYQTNKNFATPAQRQLVRMIVKRGMFFEGKTLKIGDEFQIESQYAGFVFESGGAEFKSADDRAKAMKWG